MDQLDQAIHDLRRKIAKWTRLAEQGRIELQTLEKAAKLRPANGVESGAGEPEMDFGGAANGVRKGGRQLGAISPQWRNILEMLYFLGGKHAYADVHKYARQQGINIDIASTRDRVRGFLKANLMTGTPEEGFEVTEEAMRRFGFGERESAPPWDGDIPDEADKAEGA